MFKKKRWAILVLAVLIVAGFVFVSVNRSQGQQVPATAATASVATPSMTPSAPPSASATPTAQTPSASATPTATTTPTPTGPTTGPMSDYPITKTCASTPTRPPYVGYCKVKGRSLTGHQAFNACRAVSIHTMWAVKGEKYGKEDPKYTAHAAQCLGSLGMSGTGMFFGFPEDGSLKWMVISGVAKDGDRYKLPFDATTGKLTLQDDVMETVDAWYGENNGG